MSFKENPHPHQSEFLTFLSPDYEPIKLLKGKIKRFGVISFVDGKFKVGYQKETPAFGGYISKEENIYGNPIYCRNATKLHLKHKEIYGTMPHLVFFASEEAAKKAGFRKCKICS